MKVRTAPKKSFGTYAYRRRKEKQLGGDQTTAPQRRRRHSIAITASGAVLSWGEGERGCLGHGEDLSNQLLPKKVEMWARGQ